MDTQKRFFVSCSKPYYNTLPEIGHFASSLGEEAEEEA